MTMSEVITAIGITALLLAAITVVGLNLVAVFRDRRKR